MNQFRKELAEQQATALLNQRLSRCLDYVNTLRRDGFEILEPNGELISWDFRVQFYRGIKTKWKTTWRN